MEFVPPSTIDEWIALSYVKTNELSGAADIPDNLAELMAGAGFSKTALLAEAQQLIPVKARCVVSRVHLTFLQDVLDRMG